MIRLWERRLIAIATLLCMGSLVAVAQIDVVTVTSGQIKGVKAGGVISFKGVPFAAPPIGDLRWQAPQPVKPWPGIRSAANFGADCSQAPAAQGFTHLQTTPAEDCLYLNVWAPIGTAPSAKHPVMVWIEGGGYTVSGSSEPWLDGSKFAEKGVVLVTINYRLGRMGFFGFPGLTKENTDGLLGNYGVLDQIAALKWVQENAAAFGGDASNVTVFGESAGGGSVLMLLTSPLGGGLFAKAIVQSGGGRLLLEGQRYLSTAIPHGVPSAEDAGVAFARSVGIRGTGADAVKALRALPAEKVVGDLAVLNLFEPTFSGPVIDGHIVIAEPQDVFLAGGGQNVPLMIGGTSTDIGLAPRRSKDALFATFGPDEEAAKAVYDPTGKESLDRLSAQVGSDRETLEPARFVAATLAARGVPTYEYRFSYVPEFLRAALPGAPHGSDVPFVFDMPSRAFGPNVNAADEAAAQHMSNAWVAFAQTGNPTEANGPAWPSYSPVSDMLMDFTASGPVAKVDPWKARLDLAAGFYKGFRPPMNRYVTDVPVP